MAGHRPSYCVFNMNLGAVKVHKHVRLISSYLEQKPLVKKRFTLCGMEYRTKLLAGHFFYFWVCRIAPSNQLIIQHFSGIEILFSCICTCIKVITDPSHCLDSLCSVLLHLYKYFKYMYVRSVILFLSTLSYGTFMTDVLTIN